jgi:hypothetical protein
MAIEALIIHESAVVLITVTATFQRQKWSLMSATDQMIDDAIAWYRETSPLDEWDFQFAKRMPPSANGATEMQSMSILAFGIVKRVGS